MTCSKKLYPFKTGPRPRHGGERENMVNAAPIGSRRHHTGSEQSLDLRRKKKPIALPRPKQRRNAEAVAAEMELMFRLIPQRDRKLSAQFFPHLLAMVLKQMRNDLGIAVRNQAVATPAQFDSSLDVIEKLAVEHNRDGAVFIADRLLAISQTDNAQPPRG